MFINGLDIIFIYLTAGAGHFDVRLFNLPKKFFIDKQLVAYRFSGCCRPFPTHDIFVDFTLHIKAVRGGRQKADFYLINPIIQRVDDGSVLVDIRL